MHGIVIECGDMYGICIGDVWNMSGFRYGIGMGYDWNRIRGRVKGMRNDNYILIEWVASQTSEE